MSHDLAVPVGPDDHVRGDPDAPVTVVEYADAQCPYCRRFEGVLRQLLAERPHVRLVYRHFPLVHEHQYAYSAALAMESAARAGRFWELHDLLLREDAPLGRQALTDYAGQLDLPPAKLLRPYAEKYDGDVRDDVDGALDSGVEGTPSVFVQGVRLLGVPSLDELRQAVDRFSAA